MLTIGRYDAAQREGVWALYLMAQREAQTTGDPRRTLDIQRIEAVYLAGGEFLVGVEGPHVLAMGALRPDGDRTAGDRSGEIVHLYVHPEARRRGHGHAMLAALEASALARGWHALSLQAGPDCPALQRLVASRGYEAGAQQAGLALPVRWHKRLAGGSERDVRPLADRIPY